MDAALRAGSRYQAVKDGALEMIVPIVESSKTSETDEHCCRCVELYAQDISARELMIDTGVIAAMDELTSGEDLDNSAKPGQTFLKNSAARVLNRLENKGQAGPIRCHSPDSKIR